MSHKELFKMLSNVDEGPMLDFLAGMGVIATEQQCEFCGGDMKRVKDGKSWYWQCSRRANGVKCNLGKFGVRSGTFVGNSKLACNSIHPVVCVAFCASSQRSTAQTVHVC